MMRQRKKNYKYPGEETLKIDTSKSGNPEIFYFY